LVTTRGVKASTKRRKVMVGKISKLIDMEASSEKTSARI